MDQKVFRYFIFYLATFFLANILIADIPQPIEEAFNNMEADTLFQYAFQKRTLSKEQSFLESYDPSRPPGQKWQLISVSEGTDRDKIQEQIDKKNQRENPNKGKNISISEEDMQGFKLIDETNNVLTYS